MQYLSKVPSQKKSIAIINNSDYALLSNTAQYGFAVDGQYFRTFLHYYYYYLSSDDKVLQQKVFDVKSCEGLNLIYNIKYYSKACFPKMHICYYDWRRTIKIILRGISSKISQNYDVKMMLLSTKHDYLYYSVGNDNFLGTGFDNSGLNIMGILYMVTRDKLINGNIKYSRQLLNSVCTQLSLLEINTQRNKYDQLAVIYESDEDDEYE